MAILEKLTANMELTELKKFNFQKSILRLMLEWKHLEDYMDSTQNSFHECLEQLQHKENHLNLVQESALESNKELESVRASIERRMEDLGDKERQFNVQVSELGLKEKRLFLIENSIEERINEVELREEGLKGFIEGFKVEGKRFEGIREEINSRKVVLDDKEKEFNVFRDEQVNELDLEEKRLVFIAKSVEERVKQVELREEEVKVLFEKFKVEEKRFEKIQESAMESNKELEYVRASIERRMEELSDKERQFNVQISELGLKENRLVLIENSNEERVREVELLEEKLNEEFKGEEKRLEGIRESVGERIEEMNCLEVRLDGKEKAFNAFRDEQVNELDLKEKRLVLITKSVEERVKQVELREDEMKAMFKEFKVEEKQFKKIQESSEERVKQVELREEKVKVMFEEFKVEEKRFEKIQKSFRERIDDIDSKQMELDERFQELDGINSKQMELDQRFQELDGVRDCIERRVKELDAKEEDFEKRLKELDERSQELDGVRDWIKRRVKELDAKEETFDKRLKELESKEKEINDQARETVSMGKQIINEDPTKVETEVEFKDNPVNGRTDIEFCDKMGGKRLQRFLNQREKDHKSMAEEVYQTLQLSPDPAKLVLDAMEGFYQTDPNEGKREFKLDVIRRSCILLLEQLLRVSPQVKPHLKVEATKLICQWKAKLSTRPDLMEALGHLYLLASYCLPVPFNKDELLGLIEIVAEHRRVPELCRLLGFTDRIPDLIRNLVKKKHNLVAVRFISEFGLGDEFPPAGLLIDYMKHVKMISKMMLRENNLCIVQQNEIKDKRVAAMREVIRCIKDHKLESKYSPKGIEQSIDQILMHKGVNKGTAPSSPNKPVTDMAFIIANMDGRSLLFFLNEHFEDHELMRNVVLLALGHSFDPARLVLEAMQGFHLWSFEDRNDEHFEMSVIRSSCILLLEQLLRLQRPVKPKVKGEAMAIARHWKLKMREEIENPQVILGFLQFIGAFELTSRFNNDQLLCLIEKIASHPHARELCKVLGFSKKKPGCVLHPCESKGSSLENAPLNKPVGFVNLSPSKDSNSLRISMERKSEAPIFHHVSDPAKLVLDAIRGCYHSNVENWSEFSKSKIMDTFFTLLKQLKEASPEIKSKVQEEAMAFSVDWNSKLSVSRENQAEVKAFLHLLATYKLPSSVLLEVLHRLLESVRDYKQKFEFLRLLNITHKIPDYVQYLIEKDERLLAIRFIYEFELVEKFPPVPIIKSQLCYIEKFCTKICEEGNYSHEALDRAADKEVGLLRAVIRFMSFHENEFDCTHEGLQVLIDKIIKQKEDRKVLIPTVDSMAQKQQELDVKKRAINLEVQTREQNATKRPRLTALVTAPQNGAPMAPHEASYPINPTQGTPWQYSHGAMAPLGWQYNRPDGVASYHGAAPNMIPRPFIPQPTPPYLYRPWQQP